MGRESIAAWLKRGMALGLGLMLLYGLYEPRRIVVHELRIKNPDLARVLGNRTIVHLSDLHLASWGSREERLVELVERLQPDLIFLTGDYVAWKGNYEPALKFLSRLRAKTGTWAVFGDYDHSDSRQSCLFCHERGSEARTRRHSVHFVNNAREKVGFPAGDLEVLGFDEEAEGPAPDFLSAVTGTSTVQIVLTHSPLFYDRIAEDRPVLVLAGDTHGGQVPLPSWLFNVLGYRKSARYVRGLFREGRKSMAVSQGLGTSHIPVRFLRPPEISVYHFEP